MQGSREAKRYDCVVIGGGITGLSAAHRLQELAGERGRRTRICLLEGQERLGGNIRTERVDGALLEGGPDQFVLYKPAALELCRRLGLGDEIVEIDARQTATHVVRRGRPVRLPEGFTLLGPTRWLPLIRSPFLSWRGLLRAAWEPWVPARPASAVDESLRSFVTRRFGRELHDNVFEPVMGGIFTADTSRLSLDMTARRLLQLEREHGSISRALLKQNAAAGSARPAGPPRGGCVALRSGMGRLVARLRELLPPDAVRTGVEARSVRPDGAGWRIVVDGGVIQARTVILACPGYASARLVRWDERLSRLLDSLQYASSATVNLVYAASALERPLDGFGFFCGQNEKQPILACNHVSVKFPERVPEGRVLLRAFLGGAHDPAVLDRSDGALIELAHSAVARLAGIRGEPSFARAYRYPLAMPQFDVGYRARLEALVASAAELPGLYPAGGVLGSIGLPDCIQTGEAAALAATERLEAAQAADSAAAS